MRRLRIDDLEGAGQPLKLELTAAVIRALGPREHHYRVHDTRLPGLFVRVMPSGIKSFYVQWSRIGSKSLGKFPGMKLETARERALDILNDASKHDGVPAVAKPRREVPTLRKFIDEDYGPWAKAHQKWGERAAHRIKQVFAERLDKPLTDLNPWVIEKWRSGRLQEGIAKGTVNRDLATLKAALAKAVAWELLTTHPLAAVKLRKVDNERVRYLTPEEEMRLRAALAQRDHDAAAARDRANQWRTARGYDLLPNVPPGGYCDHLTPLVLVALNTGLRRGELAALVWPDIDLEKRQLVVRAAGTKSGKSRHVPLNAEAHEVLTRWKEQGADTGRVFGVRDVKKAFAAVLAAAGVEGFHFHDCRHHFASALVMAGASLNDVRELLGHADLKMTLRYAHLAPEHKARVVELLTRPRSASLRAVR